MQVTFRSGLLSDVFFDHRQLIGGRLPLFQVVKETIGYLLRQEPFLRHDIVRCTFAPVERTTSDRQTEFSNTPQIRAPRREGVICPVERVSVGDQSPSI